MWILIRFATKVGLVGGSLYLTSQYGIWNDSKRSEEIYKEVYSFVAPYVKEVPIEVPELPKSSEVTSAARQYWNHGVVATAEFLSNLPNCTYNLGKKGMTFVKDQLKEPANSEEKQ